MKLDLHTISLEKNVAMLEVLHWRSLGYSENFNQ